MEHCIWDSDALGTWGGGATVGGLLELWPCRYTSLWHLGFDHCVIHGVGLDGQFGLIQLGFLMFLFNFCMI